MVNPIDIHNLTLEELSGVISLYPWYGGARMELCRRMSGVGALSESQIAETGLHLGNRGVLSGLLRAGRTEGYAEEVQPEPGMDGFCTETLAGIYLEQGYSQEAIDIYSRLSLRYPEKSVYFAALIEEMDKKDN